MRIAVMASIGEGNLGDEIILESQILSLQKASGADVIIDVFSGDVAETKERFADIEGVIVHPFFPVGVRSVFRGVIDGSLWKSLYALWKSKCVIIGGGGIIYSKEMEIGINPLWVWYLRVLFLKVFDKKVIFSSIGVEHINEGDELLLRKLFADVKGIMVRDFGSKKALVAAGVTEGIEVMHDIVFDMGRLAPVAEVEMKGSKVVIIPREWGDVRGAVAVKYWQEVGDALEAGGFEPLFVPMSYSVPDDREMIYSIIDGKGWQYWEGPYTRELLESQLLNSIGVISVRLHGMIMAMNCNRPVLALGYGNKTASLAEYFDLPFGYLEDLSPMEVVEAFVSSLEGGVPADRKEKIASLKAYNDYYQHLFSRI